MSIPHRTRYLVLTCADPADTQFRGVLDACRLLQQTQGVHHLPWSAATAPLDLTRRKTLRWLVVSGHGAEETARVSDGRRRKLLPEHLQLPAGVPLYLLACHQGSPSIGRAWCEQTGGAAQGCAGETESALSTLFLLGLVDEGPERAEHWFGRWLEANDRLRPRFPQMRALYEEAGRDWVRALAAIRAAVDLGPFAGLLAIGRARPRVLSGLG